MAGSWLVFDRIRALARSYNIYSNERLMQNQSDLRDIVNEPQFSDWSYKSSIIDSTNLTINRLQRYKDYEMMDETGEISMALDTYADEASLIDPERKHTLIIKAKTKRIKKELENLYFNILLWDERARSCFRYLCKFGCCPWEIVLNENRNGVSALQHINVYEFTRVETKHGDLVGFYFQDAYDVEPKFLHPWQVAHMRLDSLENNYSPYGKCLPKGTMVLIDGDYIPIETVKPGDYVYSFDGSSLVETKVTNWVESGIKDVYRIKTENFEICATANHPILVDNKTYKTVDSITTKDSLVIAKPPYSDNNPSISIDAKCFGVMCGNSTVKGKYIHVDLSFLDNHTYNNYLDLFDRVLFDEVKGKKIILMLNEFPNCVREVVDKGQCVPSFMWSLCAVDARSYIVGLTDLFGSNVIKSVDRRFISDVKRLCLLANIKCSNIESDGDEFFVSLSLDTFVFDGSDFVLEKVVSVEHIGSEMTYDIQVESEFSNFVADSVVVHNSVIDGGRKAFKQLRLMEDAALIYRITRAPERRKFKIPVGNIPTKETREYIKMIAREFKRQRFYNPTTGTFDERYSPLIQEDDIFLPQRPDGTGPDVDILPGAQNLDQIQDIEYFKKKMIAPTKIPFARVGIGSDSGQEQERSLASSHSPFAKAAQWVQRVCASGLTKVGIVHLLLAGYSIDDVKGFSVHCPIISAIEELYRMEAWQTRANVMRDLKDLGWFPKEWIITNFTDLTPDEIIDLNEMIRLSEMDGLGDDSGGLGGLGGGSLGGLGGLGGGDDLGDLGDEGDLGGLGGAGELGGEGDLEDVDLGGVGDEELGESVSNIKKRIDSTKYRVILESLNNYARKRSANDGDIEDNLFEHYNQNNEFLGLDLKSSSGIILESLDKNDEKYKEYNDAKNEIRKLLIDTANNDSDQ